MGIPGLLRTLRPYTQPVHIEKYSGMRIGIDAYCWLHKGAYACSVELCEKGQNVSSMQPCLNYFMHRINLLRHYNVTPVVVFDGGRLPFKAVTEIERQRRRDQNLDLARSRVSEGDLNGAVELYQRAVEITPLIAYELIKVLRAKGVEYVVAPYEADAQLAYLSTLDPENGGIIAVISEDSDLLAYGCNVVIYKMDKYGSGEEVRLANLLGMKSYSERPQSSLWFGCFTQELFTGMCVLAGCDFLPSVGGIGIKRAHGLVSKYRDLVRVLSSLRFDPKLAVPEGYELAFKQATAIFQHARIYDASVRKLSFLKPLPAKLVDEFDGDLDFLGPDLPPSRVIAIAEGRLDPISMCAFDEVICADQSRLPAPVPIPLKSPVGGVWSQGEEESMIASMFKIDSEIFSRPTECASVALQPDKGFLSHLKHLATCSNGDDCGSRPPDEQTTTGVTVTVSPGKKRVFPLHPSNNPFKRGRIMEGEASDEKRLFESDEKIGSSSQNDSGSSVTFRRTPSSELGESPGSDSFLLHACRNYKNWNLTDAAAPIENASDDATRPFANSESASSPDICSEKMSIPAPDEISALSHIRDSPGSDTRPCPQNNPFKKGLIRVVVRFNDDSAAKELLIINDEEKYFRKVYPHDSPMSAADEVTSRKIPSTEPRMLTQSPSEMEASGVSTSVPREAISQTYYSMSHHKEVHQGSCDSRRKPSVVNKQPGSCKTQAARKMKSSGRQKQCNSSSVIDCSSATFSIRRYFQRSDPT